MERVFDNLIRNAVSYSYPQTEIFLSMRVENGTAEITVKNNGKTIPPEKLEKIFEQFYRIDSSRSSKTGGAGLGLAIAKEIVDLHGGTIVAESLQCACPALVRKSYDFVKKYIRNSEGKWKTFITPF